MAHLSGKVHSDPSAFQCQQNAAFLQERLHIWSELKESAVSALASKEIDIHLHGSSKDVPLSGIAYVTRPLDIMPKLSAKERQHNPFIAVRVFALNHADSSEMSEDLVDADDDNSVSDAEEQFESHAHLSQLLNACDGSDACLAASKSYILWDLSRPLEYSCSLEFVRFEDKEGQHVFWHSSAHILGQALELEFGGHLTVGPALKDGFYYDVFVGERKINEQDCANLEQRIQRILAPARKQADASCDESSEKEHFMAFERLVIRKEDALRLFAYNPFKVHLINAKIPDGALTSCYRCGPFIDLCRGPHVPDTSVFSSSGKSRLFSLHKHSAAYWMGKDGNDSLQRVYGVSFPSAKLLQDWEQHQKEMKQRRHQDIGQAQELFFFEEKYSPGSAFWMPQGARLYNKLCEWMRSEQRLRGFTEVMTPNMFRSELFKTSAHYWTYPERYSLDIEGEEWMLKPMNCPGHCAIFRHRVRSYKELPIRMSDFGVLHRKEPSGSLSGLTRVRRFVQDDGHIFCRPDQVAEELSGALEFMKYIYGVLGLQYSFVLSTRPKKAIGSREIWNNAERQLAEALNKACVSWKLNKGDGAFYGPKIDILITDIAGKQIQCATIQLDFQLPLRFNLQFDNRQSADVISNADVMGEASAKDAEKKTAVEREQEREQQLREKGLEGPLKPGFARPVMIHRAVFGSLERFSAILMEHFSGKWPFFLNPRQVMVVPVHPKHNEYSEYVARQMFRVGGLYAECNTDKGGNMQKKISRAIEAKFSFVAVVGDSEQENLTVTIRPRDSIEASLLVGSSPMQDAQEERRLMLPLAECIDKLRRANMPRSQDVDNFDTWYGMDPRMVAKACYDA